MNVLVGFGLGVLFAGVGMYALAVLRPHLKAAWWLALAVLLGGLLLWAAVYPGQAQTWAWPGRWAPVLPPPASLFTPTTWAIGLLLLAAAWAALALASVAPNPPIAAPRPWSVWLALTWAGLVALTASEGWALAVAWAGLDLAVLALEARHAPSTAAGEAAWRRLGARASFWLLPLLTPRLPTISVAPLWALAALVRVRATPRPGRIPGLWGTLGHWAFVLPGLVTVHAALPHFAGPWPWPLKALVAALGLLAALPRVSPGAANRDRAWWFAATALVVLAASRAPEAGQVWLWLLFAAGMSLPLLRQAPDAWLLGGATVALAGPALLWPFTPTAAGLRAWHWPPTWDILAQAGLYALLVRGWWERRPMPRAVRAAWPLGSQVLAGVAVLLLPAGLWGVGLRLGTFTPPTALPGWLPWLAGPALVAVGAAGARWRARPRIAALAAGPFPLQRLRAMLRGLARGLGTALENGVLFVTQLLEGDGGWFWALVVLGLLFLWRRGG